MATALAQAEGWKWGEAYLDFPYIAGMERAFPKQITLSDEDAEALETAQAQLLGLSEEYEEADELPDEIDTKMSELETEIARLQGLTSGYLSDDKARAGIIVSLTADGQPKFERGLIRPEDVVPEPEPEVDEDEEMGEDATAEGGDGGDFRDDQRPNADADDDDEPESPLSDGLVRDLTAHRTLAFRLALGEQPEIAGRALAHLLVMDTFYKNRTGSCLEIRPVSADLRGWLDGYDQSSAVEALDARHLSWAEKMPRQDELWAWVLAMDPEDLGLLMAHCIGLTVNVVRGTYGIPAGLCFADQLATSLSLDVGEHWKPTAASYFNRVTKGHIAHAVREAVSADDAERTAKLKKPDMAEAAEALIASTHWLPSLLRTKAAAEPEPESEAETAEEPEIAPETEPLPEAAE
jgi:ParB family chromosome partitioning protein